MGLIFTRLNTKKQVGEFLGQGTNIEATKPAWEKEVRRG